MELLPSAAHGMMQLHSEGREWAVAAALVLSVWGVCVVVVWWAIAGWGDALADVELVVRVVFGIIGGIGGYLAVQALRHRRGRAVLRRERGEPLLRALGAEFQRREQLAQLADCRPAPGFGYWRPIGRLRLSGGEIEVKEVWFHTLFFRTQVALRGDCDRAAVEQGITAAAAETARDSGDAAPGEGWRQLAEQVVREAEGEAEGDDDEA